MSNRKETPDVLGELLGGGVEESAPVAATVDASAAKPKKSPAPRRAKAPATGAPPVSPPPPPPQWEYLEVTFREVRGWRPQIVNGRELARWKEKPVLQAYLAELGAEGWELVTLTEPRHYQRDAYLKRIKRL